MLKAGALTDSTIELPEARIAIELPDGQLVLATGFIIRGDAQGNPTIILKAPRLRKKQ